MWLSHDLDLAAAGPYFQTRGIEPFRVVVTWTVSFEQSFPFIILVMKRMGWERNGVHLKI